MPTTGNPGRLFAELRRRNPRLYRYGWLCWLGAALCLLMAATSDLQVVGVNAWIKPAKFFVSVAIAVWTLGWLLHWLGQERTVRQYTTMTLITMSIELVIITGQAARGRQSHFNVATWWEEGLFQVMGVAITVFTIWTLVIAVKFSRNRPFSIPAAYLWGIRIGLWAFVIFALEGGVMGGLLRHSVGGEDGPGGLPLLHWSTRYGDLRAAHFMGIHALQVLPFAGWLLGERRGVLLLFAVCYLAVCVLVLVRAIMGLPVWS